MKNIIQSSAAQLTDSSTPVLDIEILLMHILKMSRAQLYIRDCQLTDTEQQQFQYLLDRRIKGEPIAYLVGHQEFWSLDLLVTSDVLIPRPETELLVETVLELLSNYHVSAPHTSRTLLDLGTGSGAIALSIASEYPELNIVAVDKSLAALNLARKNAEKLKINHVSFIQSNWFENIFNQKFDFIVSNPPYIKNDDKHLSEGDVRFEPKLALVSGEEGLDDIQKIISESKNYLKSNGYLLLEHGFDQGNSVRELFRTNDFDGIKTIKDLAGLDRLTLGINCCKIEQI